MGRLYTATFQNVAYTAANDFFEVLTSSAVCAIIHRVNLTQSTEAGDSAAEMVRITLHRVTGAPTSGSGGTTPTPIPHSPGDAAAVVTVEANNSTPLSGGTSVLLLEEAVNVFSGFDHFPAPEQRFVIAPSTRFMVKLASTPADSISFSGYVTFEEIG